MRDRIYGALCAFLFILPMFMPTEARAGIIESYVEIDFELDPGAYIVEWNYVDQWSDGVVWAGTNAWLNDEWIYYAPETAASGLTWVDAFDGVIQLVLAGWADISDPHAYYVHTVGLNFYSQDTATSSVPAPAPGLLVLMGLGVLALRRLRIPQ